MAFPLLHRSAMATALACSLGMAFAPIGDSAAQTGNRAPAPNRVFCIDNSVQGSAITAEIKAGAAVTKVQLPAGQHGCCVKFCADNPAPAGYQVSVLIQPAGGKLRKVCQADLVQGEVLRVTGTAAQAHCAEGKL